jgi:uncharacterized membrane protein YgcG
MKFYQKRGVALVVLVLAIAAAVAWGQFKRPAALPNVSYGVWIRDDANLLSADTESTISSYNSSWDSDYRAVVAVATVDSIKGWKQNDFADTLGNRWGLGANDMLLLMVKGGNWYVATGTSVQDNMTDTQQSKLAAAVDGPYYSGDYDGAAVAFFRQADVYYAQAMGGGYSSLVPSGGEEGTAAWHDHSGLNIGGVILLIAGIFVVWVLLDRMRYRSYRRRYMGPAVVTPVVPYYPIFWGRQHVAQPYRPRPVQRPSGGHSAPRPKSSAPHHTSAPHSGGASHGGRGGFGGGGFGGGRR